MSFSRNKRQETLIYLVLWGVIFIAPALSQYVRTASVDATFDWQELFMVWKGYGVFFAIFLIHNHLLAPLLVYSQRKTLYFSIVGVLAAAFVVWQCNNRPEDRFMKMKERTERFGPRPSRLDGQRPPEFGEQKPPEFDERRPPEFDQQGPPRHLKGNRPPLVFGQHDLVALIILILMLGANLGVKFYFKQRRDQQQLADLERQNLEQQLEYLKYQINPHFLMNTLNNIHALVDIDPERAKDTIVQLSKLLRFMLYEGSKPTVPIARELAFLDDYIQLMRLRYTDKVAINFSKPPEMPDAQVPPLLFITFVENAFKHGVSYRQDSYIDIETEIRGTKLHFECRNSRIPETEDQHGGVGLQNVKQRLELIYGKNFTLNINDQPDSYQVQLTIPLQK